MPNYLICTCGSELFKIVNENHITCTNCFIVWTMDKLEYLNSEGQKKIAKEERIINETNNNY